jgi:4-amino-4-deoxy-L-arabinose transferase-like glycosyltransferase
VGGPRAAALGAVRPRGSRADLFVLCWLVLPARVLLARGLEAARYILPCLPPLAILVGRLADRWTRGRRRRRRRVAALLGLVLAALVFAAAFVLRARASRSGAC